MIDTLMLLGRGFLECFTVINLISALIGVLIGTLIGVLPGLGISGTVAILLPATYGMSPLTAVILIAGVYYGAQYGGAITSVLVNMPGEATSIVTCFDGHPLAKRGLGGKALAVSAISSFAGGTVGLVGLTFCASWLARIALSFGKGEFFAIVVFGLLLLTNLSGKERLKGIIVVCMGVIIGCIGLDELWGMRRFTYGVVHLYKGISFVTFIMGVYGISELLSAVCSPEEKGDIMRFHMRDQFPTVAELRQISKSIARGCAIGFGIGLVPGAGATIATFCAYGAERSFSKHPEKFGTGALEGIAAPEASNNAAIYGGMVALLSLGLPFTSSMAMLMSAFVVHGITPGPMLITEHPEIFWGLIASMFIGNILLLIINLPLVGIWASLLKIDFSILMPIITFITFTGGYAINGSLFDLGIMVVCGLLGFFLGGTGYNMAALAVGMFLSGTLEDSLAGTMTLYHGNLMNMMLNRPIAAVILSAAVLVVLISSGKNLRRYVINRFRAKSAKAAENNHETKNQ